jgi:hypothetical protein
MPSWPWPPAHGSDARLRHDQISGLSWRRTALFSSPTCASTVWFSSLVCSTEFRESAYESIALVDRSRPVMQDRDGERRFRMPGANIGVLDVTFAPGRLFTTESAGIVRCLSTENGDELWTYDPGDGTHVLSWPSRSEGEILLERRCWPSCRRHTSLWTLRR